MTLSCAATAASYPAPLPSHRRASRALSCASAVCPARRRTITPRPALSCAAPVYTARPFAPEVAEAADSLLSEFREVDNLVACNSARVLKAFQNARVGSHFKGHNQPLMKEYEEISMKACGRVTNLFPVKRHEKRQVHQWR